MRKPRLIAFSVALLLLASCWWAWRDRDRLASGLINPLLSGSEIGELRGLQLSPGHISLERLTLLFEDGAQLELQEMQLDRPFDLIFGSEHNRSRLDVATLVYTPAPPHSERETAPSVAESGELRLSQLGYLLQRYLPQSVSAKELRWQSAQPETATLELERDHRDSSLQAILKNRDRTLYLRLQGGQQQVDISSRLTAAEDSEIASLTGKITATAARDWEALFEIHANLQQLRALPLPKRFRSAAASATGDVKVTLAARLPDRLLELGDYRNVKVHLVSEDTRLTVPQDLLGTELALSLATTEPLVATAISLRPLAFKDINGRAALQVSTVNPSRTLLQADLNTSGADGAPKVELRGNLSLEAASPLLHAPRWRETVSPFALEEVSGNIAFFATANLSPLHQAAGGTARNPHDISVQIEKESRANLTLSERGEKETPLRQLGWQKAAVEVQVTDVIEVSAAQWPGKLSAVSEGLQIHARNPAAKSEISIALKQLQCDIDEETHCEASTDTALNNLALNTSGAEIADATLKARVQYQKSPSGQHWQLQQAVVDTGRITHTAVTAADLTLRLPELQCAQNADGLHCESDWISASTTSVETEQVEAAGLLELTGFDFRTGADKLLLKTLYASDDIQLTVLGQHSANAALNGTLQLNGNTLQGKGEIHVGSLAANGNWQHNLESQSGSARFSLPQTDFRQDAPLSRSIAGLPVDIVSGSLKAKGELHWPAGDSGNLHLQFEKIAGTYNDSFAIGATGRISALQRDAVWVTDGPQALSVEKLDVGIPLEKIRFSVRLDKDRDLVLRDLHAELLDGTAESDRLTWNLNGETRRSEVSLNGISLKRLTTEMEAENFAASGVLDLRIPLITDKSGVTVEQGHVEARPPGGRLRYYGAFSPTMLASNPQLKLIAGALEDYNYRELSGTVEYPPSGDMQLDLKLVGRSDSVAADRDLIINLNLENNVPDMLRSLQATRDLTETLEKQVQ